jgi:ferredoxin
MASLSKKYPDNIPGQYYVDILCIACDACVGIAPEFFKMNDDEGHAFVYRQPASNDEISVCEEALAACPVIAIGNNGIKAPR